MTFLNSKPEEAESEEDFIFGKFVVTTFKRFNKKLVATKKINNIYSK